jgi:hypothetical protein
VSREQIKDDSAVATESLLEIAQRLAVIQNILDDIRDDIRWAVQNDRAIILPLPARGLAAMSTMTPTQGELF